MDAKKTMKNKLKLYITLGIVGVVILVGSLVALNWEQILRMTSTKEATPIFVFNESEAPDWWAGDSYNAQESVNPEEYQGPEPIDTLPFASINVMKGKKGYIQVSGVCPAALELDGTLRISEAVSLINNTEI